MDLELKNVSVYSKDLYWMLKAIVQLEKEFEGEGWFFLKPLDPHHAFHGDCVDWFRRVYCRFFSSLL